MGVFRQPFVSRRLRWVRAVGGITGVKVGAAPSLRKTRKRRWVLPDGRRFYGTDAEAAVLVAQIRAFQERLKAEAEADKPKTPTKRTAKAKRAKPKSVKPVAIFDIPAELMREPAVEIPLETIYLSQNDLQRVLDASTYPQRIALRTQRLAVEAEEIAAKTQRLAAEAEMAAIREWQRRDEEDIEILLLAA